MLDEVFQDDLILIELIVSAKPLLLGAAGVARWIKCLLCRNEDLNYGSQHSCTELDAGPRVLSSEMNSAGHWSCQLLSSRCSERSQLNRQAWRDRRDSSVG